MAKTSTDNNNSSKRKSSFKDVLTKVVDAVKTPFKKSKEKSDVGGLEDSNDKKAKKRSPAKTKDKSKDKTKDKSKEKILKKLPAKTRAPSAPKSKKRSPAKFKKQEVPDPEETTQLLKPDKADVPFAENSSNQSDSKFFYSNDKFIDTFEDEDIYKFILSRYKNFTPDQPEGAKRSTILQMLDDDEFMKQMFSYFDMNILDFLKFLFRLCPSIFKGFFISKIQTLLSTKQYVKDVKFAKYTRLSKKASAKRYSFL